MTDRQAATAEDVDRWTQVLWRASQQGEMVTDLAGQLQDLANEMRRAVGLAEFGWNTTLPDNDSTGA